MKKFPFVILALVALEPSNAALAADLRVLMPVKAPRPVPAYDWTGFYLGGHFAYAAGSSDWSATQIGAAAPTVTGALDLFNTYDAFKGTGSFFGGLQAGYNYSLPSRWVLGVEADASFPSVIGGTGTISSASIGAATYAEQVEFSGTVRGRVGYAPGNWLIYATGGLAWTYDQFTRTQVAGTPVGGTAVAGTVETALMVPRAGWTVGGGAEVALPSGWTARAEYLLTGYGTRSVVFPAAAAQFDSNLAVHEVRLGLNYRLAGDSRKSADPMAVPAGLETDNFAVHGQTTLLEQYDFPFRAPYRGANSLDPNIGRETWDATAYLGARLWSGAELWVNPEIDQGFGLSGTLGVAGFPSGEAYKVGSSVKYVRLPRMFVRQTINLGGETQKLDASINQFSGSQTADRLVITVGKFGVTDIFDTNKYAHDPRGDFMNWAIVDTGTWDYAADAWGYTYGASAEWYAGQWTFRAGLFDLSIAPNTTNLDPQFGQFQWDGEIEHRYELWGQPGKIALTGFLTRGRMGRFDAAVQLAQLIGGPADITAVRRYTSRGGISVNVEQQITEDLGAFGRAGWADGSIEPYEFTDVDRTVAAGLVLAGKQWGRPDDTIGFAGLVNGISSAHQAFLNAGGLGILVGDGMLPNPGLEQIIETYYALPISFWKLTFDYQFIVNPGYNRDRGPVSVVGTRLHAQF
jgi:high affinity Mn2+ porin